MTDVLSSGWTKTTSSAVRALMSLKIIQMHSVAESLGLFGAFLDFETPQRPQATWSCLEIDLRPRRRRLEAASIGRANSELIIRATHTGNHRRDAATRPRAKAAARAGP